jgi:signal peptidase I
VPPEPADPAEASWPVEEVELLAAPETVRVQDFRTSVAEETPTRPTPPPPTRRRGGWGRGLLSWVAVILVALLISFGLRLFVVQTFWIPSPSMEPTLHGCHGCNNDRVLVDKVSYRLHPIRRGDVIVFDRPREVTEPDRYLIKRVIGIPGDTVSGHDGKVWIDNRPLNEPYVNRKCGPLLSFRATTVPPGKVFVMGDNRCNSFDSRLFGSIPTSTVIGRAFLVIWPVSHRHWL